MPCYRIIDRPGWARFYCSPCFRFDGDIFHRIITLDKSSGGHLRTSCFEDGDGQSSDSMQVHVMVTNEMQYLFIYFLACPLLFLQRRCQRISISSFGKLAQEQNRAARRKSLLLLRVWLAIMCTIQATRESSATSAIEIAGALLSASQAASASGEILSRPNSTEHMRSCDWTMMDPDTS